MNPEPGLYWAGLLRPHKRKPILTIVSVEANGDIIAVWPISYTLGPSNRCSFGPRIPQPDELKEVSRWTEEPMCPKCDAPVVPYEDEEGKCSLCGTWYLLRAKYIVSGKRGSK